MLTFGIPAPKKEVPTLKEFAPRFVDEHARANRQKPSGIVSKESILRLHLIPQFGARTLDRIGNEQVQQLKVSLRGMAPKTVNNVLSVLNVLFKQAVAWGGARQDALFDPVGARPADRCGVPRFRRV